MGGERDDKNKAPTKSMPHFLGFYQYYVYIAIY